MSYCEHGSYQECLICPMKTDKKPDLLEYCEKAAHGLDPFVFLDLAAAIAAEKERREAVKEFVVKSIATHDALAQQEGLKCGGDCSFLEALARLRELGVVE